MTNDHMMPNKNPKKLKPMTNKQAWALYIIAFACLMVTMINW